MGVAGVGKTTLGRALAKRLGWAFLDADDLHPEANVEKMRAGVPLGDADRAPWLERISDWLDGQGGRPSVVACSALKRAYRERLLAGRRGVRLVYVSGDRALVAERMLGRAGHYMPLSLLDSQFRALEPPGPDETPVVIEATATLDAQVVEIVRALEN